MNKQSDRTSRFLDLLLAGLRCVADKRTQTILKDRTAYIGASDISIGKQCFRKSVLDKLSPQRDRSLEEMLTLERGHWLEHGILDALRAASIQPIHQLEICFHTQNGTLCKFHLDLVLVSVEKTIIIESKSFRNSPDATPYESHEAQIKCQVEALRRYWDTPCFRLSDSQDESLHTFPELIRALAKSPVTLMNSVEGWLLCIGGDTALPLGPYDDVESTFWAEMMDLADSLKAAVSDMQVDQLSYAKGIYPLCDYCLHIRSCPKFKGMDVEELAPLIGSYHEAKRERDHWKAEEARLNDALKAQYAHLCVHLPKGQRYLNSSRGNYAVFQSSRSSIAKERLVSALRARDISEEEIAGILAESSSSSSFPKLMFHPPSEKAFPEDTTETA